MVVDLSIHPEVQATFKTSSNSAVDTAVKCFPKPCFASVEISVGENSSPDANAHVPKSLQTMQWRKAVRNISYFNDIMTSRAKTNR